MANEPPFFAIAFKNEMELKFMTSKKWGEIIGNLLKIDERKKINKLQF